jgi:hypothetical protein
LDFVVSTFVDSGASLVLAVDDTLFGRSGRKVADCFFHHDGSQPAGSGHRTLWANNWVVLGVVVCLPFRPERPVCLPILFRLWRPRRDEHPDRPTKPELARKLVCLVAGRYAARRVQVVADAGYAAKALLRDLPANVTATVRMRANAVVCGPQPPRTGGRGCPRLQGDRLGSLGELACAGGFEQITTPSGACEVKVIVGQWYAVCGAQGVQVLLVRRPGREGFDIALLCTDMHASAGEIITRYRSRWSIETCFQDAKQTIGVGQARNRTPAAVARTVPFGFLCQTLAQVWYALHGDTAQDVAARRATAPWHHNKTTASSQDILVALRRTVIRAQYRPQHHQRAITRKIAPAPSPQAATVS